MSVWRLSCTAKNANLDYGEFISRHAGNCARNNRLLRGGIRRGMPPHFSPAVKRRVIAEYYGGLVIPGT